ncbi:MAG: hypothetical protein E3J30_04250 [Anaerolineales bacterium]|nr:MAG: hypothetical protein E3J30_04250 [Anaerolineales bacterium]
MRRWLILLIPFGLLLLAIGFGGGLIWAHRSTLAPTAMITPTFTPSQTPTKTPTPTTTPTATDTLSPTYTNTPAFTSTITLTPTVTYTPSITPSPTATPELRGRVSVQANCRYGPGSAYLYEWGLFPGNRVTVLGRNQEGTWVYVDPWTYMDYCWVKTEFLELTYDVSSVVQIRTLLPYTEFYWAPRNVRASRLGDEVMVNWDLIPMSLDDNRGYLIEGWLCKDGQLRFTPLQFWAPPAILTDEPGCVEPSHARIYTAEKHGYSEWVAIAWPPHPTSTP